MVFEQRVMPDLSTRSPWISRVSRTHGLLRPQSEGPKGMSFCAETRKNLAHWPFCSGATSVYVLLLARSMWIAKDV